MINQHHGAHHDKHHETYHDQHHELHGEGHTNNTVKHMAKCPGMHTVRYMGRHTWRQDQLLHGLIAPNAARSYRNDRQQSAACLLLTLVALAQQHTVMCAVGYTMINIMRHTGWDDQ